MRSFEHQPFGLDENDPLVRAMVRQSGNGGLPEVVKRVSRLNSQADAAGFLESATVAFSEPDDDTEERISNPARPGSALGDYVLVRQIGRGGFGRVFEGYHRDRPDQLVAVKVFEHRWLDAIERLEIERLVLHHLQHPNLVSAIDSGQTEDGTSFLVMKLVSGTRIDRYVHEQKLDWVQIAEIFVQLAGALDYAHEQDVLHRDLKPSNILVTEGHIPVVTDFGLAKRLHLVKGQSLTATGALIGTLGYMAPEQTDSGRQEITRSVDVYGLGATLYQVLTGHAPLERENLVRALEELRTQTPKNPADLNPGIPADLQTICMKCLAKSPRDRYTSMQELADDLQRFAAGQPVAARGLRLWQKSVRWCQANPLVAGLSISLGAAVVAGLVASVILWQQAVHQKQQFAQMLGTAREILQMMQDGELEAEGKLMQPAGSLKFRHDQLRKSVVFWEKMIEQFPGDDELLRDSAVTQFLLGKVCCRLGLWKESETAYLVALERFRTLSEKHPGDDTLLFDVFHSQLGLDQTDRNLFLLADGEPGRLNEAFEIISQLVLQQPDSIDYRDAWVCTASVLGARYSHTDPKRAMELVQQAHDEAVDLKAGLPLPCLQWRHVGATAGSLASLHLTQGDLEQAEYWLKISLDETEQFLKRPDLDPGELMDWAGCLSTAIRLETAKGDLAKAREFSDQWINFVNKCLRDYPEYHVFQEMLDRAPEYIGPFK